MSHSSIKEEEVLRSIKYISETQENLIVSVKLVYVFLLVVAMFNFQVFLWSFPPALPPHLSVDPLSINNTSDPSFKNTYLDHANTKMRENADKVAQAVHNVADPLTPTHLANKVEEKIENAKEKIKGAEEKVEERVRDFVGTVKEGIQNKYDEVESTIESKATITPPTMPENPENPKVVDSSTPLPDSASLLPSEIIPQVPEDAKTISSVIPENVRQASEEAKEKVEVLLKNVRDDIADSVHDAAEHIPTVIEIVEPVRPNYFHTFGVVDVVRTLVAAPNAILTYLYRKICYQLLPGICGGSQLVSRGENV